VTAFFQPIINFTNVLQAIFAPIFFCQKITNPNCNKRKTAKSTFFTKKVRVKCWWNWHLVDKVDPVCCWPFSIMTYKFMNECLSFVDLSNLQIKCKSLKHLAKNCFPCQSEHLTWWRFFLFFKKRLSSSS